jgi:predicted secreted protein
MLIFRSYGSGGKSMRRFFKTTKGEAILGGVFWGLWMVGFYIIRDIIHSSAVTAASVLHYLLIYSLGAAIVSGLFYFRETHKNEQ